MTECEFCGIVNGEFESEEIYQDDKVIAVLHLKPTVPGHILLFTKKHYPIVEEVPDDICSHMLAIANKLSTAIFESIACHGTNIIIENGTAAGQAIPHVSVHIIPRNENDKVNLEWQPKKLSNDEMDIVHAQLLAKTELISHEPEHKEQEHGQDSHDNNDHGNKKTGHDKHDSKVQKTENYKYKQLRRIP